MNSNVLVELESDNATWWVDVYEDWFWDLTLARYPSNLKHFSIVCPGIEQWVHIDLSLQEKILPVLWILLEELEDKAADWIGGVKKDPISCSTFLKNKGKKPC